MYKVISATLVLASATPPDVSITVPWGTISISLAVVFVTGMLTLLILRGVFPGISVQGKNGERVNIGRAGKGKPPEDAVDHRRANSSAFSGPERRNSFTDEMKKAIRAAAWIVKKQSTMERKIVTAQKDAISAQRPAFFEAMERVQVSCKDGDDACDDIFIRMFLIEFEDVLQISAEFNHIAAAVDLEFQSISHEYLAEKMQSLGTRYNSTKTLLKRGPHWSEVRHEIEGVVKEVLYDFARIAEGHRDEMLHDIQHIKDDLNANEALGAFIDEIALEIRDDK